MAWYLAAGERPSLNVERRRVSVFERIDRRSLRGVGVSVSALTGRSAAAVDGAWPTAFILTVADFFDAPSIDEVDVSAYTATAGDPIVIRASDDFEVTRVEVSLTDTDGTVLEEGEAASDGFRWTYTAQTDMAAEATVRIAVRALDRPGGAGEGETEVT